MYLRDLMGFPHWLVFEIGDLVDHGIKTIAIECIVSVEPDPDPEFIDRTRIELVNGRDIIIEAKFEAVMELLMDDMTEVVGDDLLDDEDQVNEDS